MSEIRPDSRPCGRWSPTPARPVVAPSLLVLVVAFLVSPFFAPPLSARTTGSVEGFSQTAHDLYSVEGCRGIRRELATFGGGKAGLLGRDMTFE